MEPLQRAPCYCSFGPPKPLSPPLVVVQAQLLGAQADLCPLLHTQDQILRPDQQEQRTRAMSSPGAPSISFGALKPKRKTKKKHFVQQKVEVFRASDPVLSVLMWGVSHSVCGPVSVSSRVEKAALLIYPY